MNVTPDCAFYWEGDMYFYQKSKYRSRSFSFLSLFSSARNDNNGKNKSKLWKTPCHIELHQMELYIGIKKNGNNMSVDKSIYLTENTQISLIERNAQIDSLNMPKSPFLYIKLNQNAHEKEAHTDNNDLFLLDQFQSTDPANILRPNNLNENSNFGQADNDDYLYCLNFHEENDLILTADEENTVIELYVAIKSALFNNEKISINDFQFISVLGRGNFGKVSLVQKKSINDDESISHQEQYYALKAIPKVKLIKSDNIQSVLNERNILSKNKHPFVVSFKFAFQTATKFYLGMEFLSGGELRNLMDKSFFLNTKFHITFQDIQIYIAEIALALNHLHSNGVVYRDLKPENILISDDGHIKLTDFGLAEEIGINGSTSSSCGTLEYIAPEIIKQSNYSFEVDWWSLGIVLYELIFKSTPFSDSNKGRLFAKIINEEVKFPEINNLNNTVNNECLQQKLNAFDEITANNFCVGVNGSIIQYSIIKDFIKKLLAKDPKKRMSFYKSFSDHPFWGDINFNDIMQKKYQPNFKPFCSPSVENFQTRYTSEKACDSVALPPIGEKRVGINGFSYLGSFILNSDDNNLMIKAT